MRQTRNTFQKLKSIFTCIDGNRILAMKVEPKYKAQFKEIDRLVAENGGRKSFNEDKYLVAKDLIYYPEKNLYLLR